jgi:hypothetical protein
VAGVAGKEEDAAIHLLRRAAGVSAEVVGGRVLDLLHLFQMRQAVVVRADCHDARHDVAVIVAADAPHAPREPVDPGLHRGDMALDPVVCHVHPLLHSYQYFLRCWAAMGGNYYYYICSTNCRVHGSQNTQWSVDRDNVLRLCIICMYGYIAHRPQVALTKGIFSFGFVIYYMPTVNLFANEICFITF